MSTTNLSKASRNEMIKSVYNGFRNAGLGHDASLVMLGEIGRENSFRTDLIFGSHTDDANAKTNIGMISWQGSRKGELERTLASQGLLSNGKMAPTQEAVNAQAKFLVSEMKRDTPDVYNYLNSDNIDPQVGMDLVGGKFIRWAMNNPKYRESGIKNRTDYYNESVRVLGSDNKKNEIVSQPDMDAPPSLPGASTSGQAGPSALPSYEGQQIPVAGSSLENLQTEQGTVGPKPLSDTVNSGNSYDPEAVNPGNKPGFKNQMPKPYITNDSVVRDSLGNASRVFSEAIDKLNERKKSNDVVRFKPPTMSDLERGRIYNQVSDDDHYDPIEYSNIQKAKWSDVKKKSDETTVGDKYWAANFASMHPIMEFFNKPDFKPETGFSPRVFLDNNKEINVNEIDSRAFTRIKDSVSTQEAIYELDQWKIRKDSTDTLAQGSQISSGALMMGATLANPVYAPTFVIGGPVIAGARATGMIGRTTLAGMSAGSQVARIGVEGLIEGAAYTGVRLAVGETVTMADVITDVGFGALLGMGLGALTGGVRRAVANQIEFEGSRAAEIYRTSKIAAESKSAEFHERAYKELGIDINDVDLRADPRIKADIAQKVNSYETQEIGNLMRIALADVPEFRKVIDVVTNSDLSMKMKMADELIDAQGKATKINLERTALRNLEELNAAKVVDDAVEKTIKQVDESVEPKKLTPEEINKTVSKVIDEFKLSKQTANSKPRYKEFDIKFKNDFDKAAYILGNDTKVSSKAAEKIKSELREQGLDVNDVMKYGQLMRDNIKRIVGKSVRGKAINTDGLVSSSEKASLLGEKIIEKVNKEAAENTTKVVDDAVESVAKTDEVQEVINKPEIKLVPNKTLEDIQDELGISVEFRDLDIKEGLLLSELNKRATRIVDDLEKGVSGRKNELAGRLSKWYIGSLEALNPDGTILRASKSNIVKSLAEIIENPTGATNGRTAALTKHILEKVYIADVDSQYQSALNAYYRLNGKNPGAQVLDQDIRKKFDSELFLYQINKTQNPQANALHPNHELFEDLSNQFEKSYDAMRVSQIQMQVKGFENLPESSVGYMPLRVSPEKWDALSASQKNAYSKSMAKSIMDSNPEITANEAFGFANSWVRHMTNKATAEQYITTTPWSRRGAAEVEQAIAEMDGTPEMKAALLAKYKKGQAKHTKSRIQRDLSTQFTDENGNTFSLYDVMEHDMLGLLRSQAGRVSGEIALKQYGVDGAIGFEQIRKIAARTGATASEMKALNRIEAEMLGLPVNGYVPNQTAAMTMSALRALYLGGLVFAQMVETFNMVPAVGAKGMFNAMVKFPELAGEAKALAAGKKVDNKLLNELDQMFGGIGKEQYKYLMPAGETGRDFIQYSNADKTVLHRIVNLGEQVQGRITFFNALLAAQQRGATEQILHKASGFIKNGGGDVAMKDMGISKELTERLKKEKDVFVYDREGRLIEFNPLKAKDAEAMADFTQSIRRGAGQMFQETFIGERGAWIHNDIWRMMGMFRGYMIGSIQKQLARSVDNHGAWKTAGFMAGAMSFALPIQYAKAQIQSVGMSPEEREKFLQKRLAPDKLAFTALSYTPSGGSLAEFASIPLAAAGQDFGTMRMGGSTSISQLSPVLGLGETLWNTPADLIGKTNESGETVRTTRNVKRLVPLGATPQVMSIMNLLRGDDN